MEKQNKNMDKLTDKAFSRLLLTSVLGILVCVMCLCSATWAWFNANTMAASNNIESGKFKLNISVEAPDTGSISLTESTDGKMLCTFNKADTYTVTLKMTEDTTVSKGFCAMTADGVNYYYTASINKEANTITFYVEVQEADLTVTFSPAWGLPARTDVESGGTLQIK